MSKLQIPTAEDVEEEFIRDFNNSSDSQKVFVLSIILIFLVLGIVPLLSIVFPHQ